MNTDPALQFQQAMADAGLPCPERPIADGEIHRFHVDGDRKGSKNGWYALYSDGVPAGAFGSWKNGDPRDRDFETWCARKISTLSEHEREQHRHRMERARRARAEIKKKEQARARHRAGEIWKRANLAQEAHPYLKQKHIAAHGVREDGNDLIVLLRDTDGATHTLQRIRPNGEKRFLTGGAVTGHYYAIGKPTGTLYVVEGFATGASIHEVTVQAVAVAFDCGNLMPVAKALRAKYPDLELVIAADNDQWITDNPGIDKAMAAARAVNAKIAIPEFTNTDSQPTDFNDLALLEGAEAVKSQLQAAEEPKAQLKAEISEVLKRSPEEYQRKLIEDLAALPPMEYDKRREQEAEAIGCRVTTLDASVKQVQRNGDSGAKGTSITFETIEPWPEDVDGGAVVREVKDAIQQHVILPSESYATAIALWILTTYLVETIRVAPRLLIKSPTKRCGKSTLMEIISHLCHRALPASNISPAAVFRTIDMHAPVLLIDEADSFLKENEELRGVVNSGHSRRLAFVIRIVGDDHEPRKFNTFAMMAIAGIKDQAETIEDRSIIVSLRRRCPGEAFTKLRNPRSLSVLSRKLAKLASQIRSAVYQAEPEDVAGMDDRATDNWEPLFAAADAIGGEWPERARNAAKALIDGEAPESLGIRLLRDIRVVFGDADRFLSVDLVEKLRSIEDGPWAEKDLTQNKLAFLLKPYKVKPKDIRVGERRKKGYKRAAFEDEWNRYVPLDSPDPPFQTVTTRQRTNHAGYSGFQGATKKESVTVQNPLKATNHAGCHVVAVQNPENGEEAWSEAEIEESPREREAIQAEDLTEAESGQLPNDLTEGVV